METKWSNAFHGRETIKEQGFAITYELSAMTYHLPWIIGYFPGQVRFQEAWQAGAHLAQDLIQI